MQAHGSRGSGRERKVAPRDSAVDLWALGKRAEKKQIRQIVRCLGIDEISLRKGHQHFAMVLTDLERHCVVAVLEERSQKALETWLANLVEAERKAIRMVGMDMWGLIGV